MIRRKTTKEILGESVQELARNRNIDKISVKEIVDNCGLSAATFYHHFHDKYELIAWMYNYQMEDIYLDFSEGAEDWRQAIQDMVVILEQNRDFYVNALKNTEGQNSFFQSTHLRSIDLLTEVIERNSEGDSIDEELLFDVKICLRGVSYSISDWIVNDLPYSSETLTDYLCWNDRLRKISSRGRLCG